MFSLKAVNINDVSKPLHFCSTLFGFTSFSIKKKEGGFKESVSYFNLLCIIFMTIWNLICTFAFFSSLNRLRTENELFLSEVFQKSMFLVISSFLSLLTIMNWCTFVLRSYYCRLLNQLLGVDEVLLSLGFSVILKKQKKRVLCLTGCTFALTFFAVGVANFVHDILNKGEHGMFIILSILICVELWILINSQIMFWMWTVKTRFEMVNSYLKHEFLTPNSTINCNGILKLNKAAELHEKLVEATELINQFYGFPVSSFNIKTNF